MLFTDCREIIPVCTTDVYLVAFGPPFDRASGDNEFPRFLPTRYVYSEGVFGGAAREFNSCRQMCDDFVHF